MSQLEKISQFRSLHTPGNPFVLYNIWDAGSAKAVAESGAKALATGSWSVAAAHGYEDGQKIPFETVLSVSERVIACSSLPVSLDIEGGYATDESSLKTNIEKVIAIGACGINFEDQVVGTSDLYSASEQASRIAVIKEVAKAKQVPLFINCRTDLFLKNPSDKHSSLIEDAIARGNAYKDAGADGFFVPGLADPKLLQQICSGVNLPINALTKTPEQLAQLRDTGVARCSFGPAPYKVALDDLKSRCKELY